MIPKKCKSCQYYEELLCSQAAGETEWTYYNPTIKSCTMSPDGRFHFNCDDYEE